MSRLFNYFFVGLAGWGMLLISAATARAAPAQTAPAQSALAQTGPPQTGPTQTAVAQDGQQSQIDAANFSAVDQLRADIAAQRLSPNLSIAEFLQQTNGEPALLDTLRHADQVGGARWIDADICQVQLSISADRVRQSLVKIAADNSQTSPLPAEAVGAKLKTWDDRPFTATGSSISSVRAVLLRPPGNSGPWVNVSKSACQQAIITARGAAVAHVLDSIKTIPIQPGKTVADLLADKAVGDAFHQWLISRPVIRLEFTNDLSVQITLAAGPKHAFDALHDAAVAAKNPLMPIDEAALVKIRMAFQDQMVSAIGRSTAFANPTIASAPNPAPAAAPVAIPAQPPQWAGQMLSGEATADYRGSTLKTEHNAENAALDDLRAKVGQLQLGNLTLADAMKQSPAIANAIESTLEQSKPSKIDFLADGRVTVKVSLDAGAIWEALRELP